MPWFYVDDQFADSKPVMAMPDRYRLAACGLWLLAGSYSAREKLDGYVPPNKLRQLLNGTRQPLREILEATDGSYEPLWVRAEDGAPQTHQWDRWQPNAAQLRREREANAARVRAWREQHPERAKQQSSRKRRGRNHLTSVDGEMLHITDTDTDCGPANVSNGVRTPPPDPDPLLITTGGVSHVGYGAAINGAAAPPPPPNPNPVHDTGGSADAPPPPCPRHPKPDHPDPCRACQAVRVWRDGTALKVAQDRAQRQQRRDQIERDKAKAIRRCDMCDVSGVHTRGKLRITCPHDPQQLQRDVEDAQRRVTAWEQDQAVRRNQPASFTSW